MHSIKHGIPLRSTIDHMSNERTLGGNPTVIRRPDLPKGLKAKPRVVKEDFRAHMYQLPHQKKFEHVNVHTDRNLKNSSDIHDIYDNDTFVRGGELVPNGHHIESISRSKLSGTNIESEVGDMTLNDSRAVSNKAFMDSEIERRQTSIDDHAAFLKFKRWSGDGPGYSNY